MTSILGMTIDVDPKRVVAWRVVLDRDRGRWKKYLPFGPKSLALRRNSRPGSQTFRRSAIKFMVSNINMKSTNIQLRSPFFLLNKNTQVNLESARADNSIVQYTEIELPKPVGFTPLNSSSNSDI